MGFLKESDTPAAAPAEGMAPAKKNTIGSLLGDYAKSRMPIMYGIGSAMAGDNEPPPVQGGTGPALEPLPQMQQPKGIGSLIMKLMGAG